MVARRSSRRVAKTRPAVSRHKPVFISNEDDWSVVESIEDHSIDEDGSLMFLIKWKGWEKDSDRTWEPESSLKQDVPEILKEYFQAIGTRSSLIKPSQDARGKKRCSSPGKAPPINKRSRKLNAGPEHSTSQVTTKKWTPPAGSWEGGIESIDCCDLDGSGELVVYVTWQNGRKMKHPWADIYEKCPRKMLQFYHPYVKIHRE